MDRESIFAVVCGAVGVSALAIFQHFNTAKPEAKGRSPPAALVAPSPPRHSTVGGAHSQSRARSLTVPGANPRHVPANHSRAKAPLAPHQAQPLTHITHPASPNVAISLNNELDMAVDTSQASRGLGARVGLPNRNGHSERHLEPLTAQSLLRHNEQEDAAEERRLEGYANLKAFSASTPNRALADSALSVSLKRKRIGHQQSWKHASRSTSVAATDGSKSLSIAPQADVNLEHNQASALWRSQVNTSEPLHKPKSVAKSAYTTRPASTNEAPKLTSTHHQNHHVGEHCTTALAAIPSPTDLSSTTRGAPIEVLLPRPKMAREEIAQIECSSDAATRNSNMSSGLAKSNTNALTVSCDAPELSPIATRPDINEYSPEGRMVTAMIEESAKALAVEVCKHDQSLQANFPERLPYFLLKELELQVGMILQNLYHKPWKPRLWMLLYSYLKQLPRSAVVHLAQCENITAVIHRLERVPVSQTVVTELDKDTVVNDNVSLIELRQDTCAMLLNPDFNLSKPNFEGYFEWRDKKIIRCNGNFLPKRSVSNDNTHLSTTSACFQDSQLAFLKSETGELEASMITEADKTMTVLQHFRHLFTESVAANAPSSEIFQETTIMKKKRRDVGCQAALGIPLRLEASDKVGSFSVSDPHIHPGSVTNQPWSISNEAAIRALKTFSCLASDKRFQKLRDDRQYAVVINQLLDLAEDVDHLLGESFPQEEYEGSLNEPNHKDDRTSELVSSNTNNEKIALLGEVQSQFFHVDQSPSVLCKSVAVTPSKPAKQLRPAKPGLSKLRRGLTSQDSSQLVCARN